jgi:phosphoketolase
MHRASKQPFHAEWLRKTDADWRAASHVSVGQIDLLQATSEDPLTCEHITLD